jgi:eukaryotic-like serine/threonine-protein kinase
VTLSAGTRLGPYEIQALIGTGGMGAVYKALDSRLGRPVAIKQLAAQFSGWFEREARAVAALNHPNICQIYDVGPDYLVLEYIEGCPLEAPTAADLVPRLATQIADALIAAHARGILHRDLKPANIMVTGSPDAPVAKLLDFGIARIVDADPMATVAATGVVGTPAYMAPEQARGDPADERTDVYGFGAILHEMLTGHRPALTQSTESASPLMHVARRCLAPDPMQRYATMAAVRAALQDAAGGLLPDAPSVAVLPFASPGANPENESFADGLTEEIIHALANVPGLKVIARTSAFAFKGKNEDVRRIADALDVSHVIEGSVRRAAERIRVTVQLVTAADGRQIWSERYDRAISDVFAMQDAIAEAIATALKVQLGAPAARQRRHQPRLPAYEPFLRGRHHLIRFTPEAWAHARALFEEAISEDPAFAEPHAELALGYFIMGMHGILPFRAVSDIVRAEARRALALNPSDPRPRVLLGGVDLAHDYDWAAAKEHFDAAMSAPDVSADARWIYASLYLGPLGRFEESSEQMGRAVAQDPLNAMWRAIWSAHLVNARRIDEALAAAERAVELDPNHVGPQFILGEAYLNAGRTADSRRVFARAYELGSWNAMAGGLFASTLAQEGQHARAAEVIGAMGDAPSPVWGRVLFHLHTSDLDAAAEWYDRMIDHRDPFALVYANAPVTAALRKHPRWPALAARMRLPVTL